MRIRAQELITEAKAVKNQKEDIILDENAGLFTKWRKNRTQKNGFNKLRKDVIDLEEVNHY